MARTSASGTGNSALSIGTASSINDGAWHHIVSTFQRAGNANTYVDGLLTATVSIAAIGDLDTGEPTVVRQDPTGAYDDGASDVVQFDLDDLGVWRRELSPTEAAMIYAAGAFNDANFVLAPVHLRAHMIAGQIQLVRAGGLLQAADQVNSAYSDVANATSRYAVAPAGAKKFYHVRQ